ncbi:hypothetical protein SARC_08601 [Sphaeroforma arctica JP610]|uniref:Uncharacterized protein n=1 Tax=Sphaeroforma arctica JP610 TaxID=667725 RepID=A0A0L0FR14_9EUKA|nr:hypothetical protein SARC_08601 [Sphaeroforma arctica JP610]KNC78986.1 hypothetical protein SARC_08601 [Sphaeroforma arctica JP610]|eukprot:XP_014152888.1 hypothetical protein SARC_08601 [Sphaeroforma arctica JP610]
MRIEVQRVLQRFRRLPVVLAPMAGVSTPRLVAAICNEGATGIHAGGFRSVMQLAQDIDEIRSLLGEEHQHAFGVNLMVPPEGENGGVDDAYSKLELAQQIERARVSVLPFYQRAQGASVVVPTPKVTPSCYKEQVDLCLDKGVPVVTFVFGRVKPSEIKRLQDGGCVVMGTATSVEEAILLRQDGVDAIFAQGAEAGGHRGSFLRGIHLVGTMSLVPQIVDAVYPLPVIAAGGIADGRGVTAARALGASASAIGTAFLTSNESEAQPLHKREILRKDRSETDTIVTDVFTGKAARGFCNDFVSQYRPHNSNQQFDRITQGDMPVDITRIRGEQSNVAPYPIQQALTNPLKQFCIAHNDPTLISMWCGQSFRLATDNKVSRIIEEIKDKLRL